MGLWGRLFIVTGLVLIVLGLGLTWVPRIPWPGRLPGDIDIHRDSFSFYFPFTTCLLLSGVLSLIFYLFHK